MLQLQPNGPQNPRPSHPRPKLTHGSSTTGEGGHVTAKERSQKNNTSMEELDRLLEVDALVLTNMKKELEITQRAELDKAFILIANLQKEYDTIKKDNSLKEKTLQNLIDSYQVLEG